MADPWKVGLLHFIAGVIAAQLPETRLYLGLQIGLLLTETHETHMTGQQKESVLPISPLRP